jgi:hypothetical protein
LQTSDLPNAICSSVAFLACVIPRPRGKVFGRKAGTRRHRRLVPSRYDHHCGPNGWNAVVHASRIGCRRLPRPTESRNRPRRRQAHRPTLLTKKEKEANGFLLARTEQTTRVIVW